MSAILYIDGYKLDHRRQYPPGTQKVYSNWTPRGSRIPDQKEVVFFGLQYFLKRYLMEEMSKFFATPVETVVDRYARRVNAYLGPNSVGTDHIRDLWNLQYVPLEFRALPEGTLTPLRVPMFTVENTHEDFAWVVNYFETLISNILWLPCTSATTAFRYRMLLDMWAKLTGGPEDFVPWQGHDFSFRGIAGIEAAQLSGAGHLLSFYGSDTIPALDLIEDYYGLGMNPDVLIGGSVPATEHSVMCAGGESGELETIGRLLDLYPKGIVSVVSDTWDLWNVITNILPQLRERIVARDGKLVIRPDSGDPVDIICGDPSAPVGSPASKGVVELLWDIFGGSVSEAGYRLLNPHIGAIYGDSITYERATEICQRLAAKKFASTNVVLGIGSYTYQYVTRDTYGFAMKATQAVINNRSYDLFKKPITDKGEKFSAKGRLAVVRDYGRLKLIEGDAALHRVDDCLRPVWRDGRLLMEYGFQGVRYNLRSASYGV